MARGKTLKETTESHSLPYRVVIDFLEGTTKKKDAISFAKGFIEHHFDSLDVASYYVQPYELGWVFEVHEGGHGHAYVPVALDALNAQPDAVVCINMARRVLEIKRTNSGSYTAILLPEGLKHSEDKVIEVEPGPKMQPFKRSGFGFFITGFGFFAAGLIAFIMTLFTVGVFSLARVVGGASGTPYDQLPLRQWQPIVDATSDPAKRVVELRFKDNRWDIITGDRVIEKLQPSSPPAQPGAVPVVPRATSDSNATILSPPEMIPADISNPAASLPANPPSGIITPDSSPNVLPPSQSGLDVTPPPAPPEGVVTPP